jgi:hypothetical protein
MGRALGLRRGRTARVRAPPRRASSRPLAGAPSYWITTSCGPSASTAASPEWSRACRLLCRLLLKRVVFTGLGRVQGITRVVGVTSVGGALHAGAAHSRATARLLLFRVAVARVAPALPPSLPRLAFERCSHPRRVHRVSGRPRTNPAAEATRVVSSRRAFLPIRVARIFVVVDRHRSRAVSRGTWATTRPTPAPRRTT